MILRRVNKDEMAGQVMVGSSRALGVGLELLSWITQAYLHTDVSTTARLARNGRHSRHAQRMHVICVFPCWIFDLVYSVWEGLAAFRQHSDI